LLFLRPKSKYEYTVGRLYTWNVISLYYSLWYASLEQLAFYCQMYEAVSDVVVFDYVNDTHLHGI